jgi:hypothetical protein
MVVTMFRNRIGGGGEGQEGMCESHSERWYFFILVFPSCSSCSSSLQWFPKGVLNSTLLYPIFFAQISPLLTYISTPSSHRNFYSEEPLKLQLIG